MANKIISYAYDICAESCNDCALDRLLCKLVEPNEFPTKTCTSCSAQYIDLSNNCFYSSHRYMLQSITPQRELRSLLKFESYDQVDEYMDKYMSECLVCSPDRLMSHFVVDKSMYIIDKCDVCNRYVYTREHYYTHHIFNVNTLISNIFLRIDGYTINIKYQK